MNLICRDIKDKKRNMYIVIGDIRAEADPRLVGHITFLFRAFFFFFLMQFMAENWPKYFVGFLTFEFSIQF